METGTHRHSKVITGFRTVDDSLHWTFDTRNLSSHEDENIEVRFFIPIKDTPSPQESDALKRLLKEMKNTQVPWLVPGRRDWTFDLDRMKAEFKGLQKLDWCKGRAYVEPEFQVKKEVIDISQNKHYETFVVFHINPEVLGMRPFQPVPVEIQQSLQDFQSDYPDLSKVAFIMMQFGNTPAHNKIVQGIRDALKPHGIHGVRADEKDYHTDLTWNVMTYLHGCGFGIAVFERIEQDDFNPNVSLEVGYIMALGKKVCLLKDQTLKALPSDLVGKLYKAFDPQDPVNSIPPILTRWMTDWRII